VTCVFAVRDHARCRLSLAYQAEPNGRDNSAAALAGVGLGFGEMEKFSKTERLYNVD
jgi:hypothetical protein